MKNNKLTILAIETSCDDTCIAVVEIKEEKKTSFKILSNIISSQIEIHKKFGGVFPTIAKREHLQNLPVVLKKAMKKMKQSEIDLVAVTNGPGLEPCLWIGINFAKELAKSWGLPIVPVNHIEGHIFANWLTPISESTKSQTSNNKQIQMTKITNSKNLFPAICLIVSGGHTQLILMQDVGKYKILGETRDDAAGECFDKTARMLGLDYPGGPAIAEQARQRKLQITSTKSQISTKFKITNSKQIQNHKFQIKLPRPMIYQKNYDFSFSGLKTAVLYEVRKKKRKSKKFVQLMALEIQQAIIDILIYKTLKAIKDYQIKTIILGGGVIANKELQKQFKLKIKKEVPNAELYIPKPNMCTDNAVMIGIVAYFNRQKRIKKLEKIKADANMRIN